MLFSTINIGETPVRVCTASSINLCYYNVFHSDFMKAFMSEDGTPMQALMQMAFIMAKFGELGNRKAVSKLTIDDYADWLDQFSNGDLINSLERFEELYMQSAQGEIDSKKNSGEPSGN